ncbi:putative TetR-family transcriptional regulator [Actinoplanes ianthinogenes]|uniref:TetR-family transcriptional regulator n=1 Tax=Actinoplanes ianthinogenes TaxID=122358 RepID=A0ABM7LP32_9ACTN|nr:TetR/AcrR family transcriptional regulator [Actinoplanes ianthinogenes]BCJ41039.1 putative TetR-family transcriptional regulator [Actinoplanes ianthinogenes]GGR23325.1 putative TetR-family transcriptional regulator [Actinoplanes ianthinogenes]
MRRTQAQRSEATRLRILDATCQSLVERGYAETTTAEVLARADVPRGTLLHHFPTKVDLLVASVQHVARRRLDALAAELSALPDDADELDAFIDGVWHHFSAPLFWAALELWNAARTDAELRAALMPVEKEIFGVLHERASALLGDDPRVPTVVQMTFEVMTGLVMTGIVSGELGRRELLIRRWKRAAAILLGRRAPDTLVERAKGT